MIAIDRLEMIELRSRRRGRQGGVHRDQVVEIGADFLLGRSLITLQRQHVSSIGLDDLLGNVSLAAHRVDGHDTAGQVEDAQQFRDGRDLVALLVDLDLAQG